MNFQYHINAELKSNIENQKKNLESFKSIINNKDNGFFHLTDDKTHLTAAKEIYSKFQNKKYFVQIGIGGSALGPQMLIAALQKNFNRQFIFLDNTDSDYIERELNKIDLKEALFYVVSKSGGTAETIACMSVVYNQLLELDIPKDNFKDYFVFSTDPSSGQLREFVAKNDFTALPVPSNIGGRFSVMTSVGLLPALFAGINIDKLYTGANSIKNSLLSVENNELLLTAEKVISLYDLNPSVNETVLMPYSSLLKEFSAWFVQLWAESLGKFSHEQNKAVGLTPVPAYGATDQHSQMQLFMEGPNNKLLFLLGINKRSKDYALNSDIDLDSARKLNLFSMNQLLNAEYHGSLKALSENKRHVIQIDIDTLNEESLGALILFFESLTALMGKLLKVDPFDQPGVELGKVYTFEFLTSS